MSSGASLPSTRCHSKASSRSSNDKTPPGVPCSGSLGSLTQSTAFKPLPQRPGSNNSCDSKDRHCSSECASRKSACSSNKSSPVKPPSSIHSRRSTFAPVVRLYFGGEELVINLDNPAEMPTIFILCPREEEELRFESCTWVQLQLFCQKFKNVVIRSDMSASTTKEQPRDNVPRKELYVAVMECKKRLILSLSLHDTVMIAREIKPIMKTRLTLPTTLGQVADECDQIPIGFYV